MNLKTVSGVESPLRRDKQMTPGEKEFKRSFTLETYAYLISQLESENHFASKVFVMSKKQLSPKKVESEKSI